MANKAIPILMALSGDKCGTKYPLDQDTIRLGRHPDCEVVVDVNAVSRFHAHIVRAGDRFVIEDLESRNGTFLNGKKAVGRVPLDDNDRIKICDTLFVYRSNAGNEPPPDKAPFDVRESDDDNATTVLTSIDATPSAEMMVTVQAEAKLKAMLQISDAIGRTLELDELFPKILDALFIVFPNADRALLVLADPSGKLIPRAVKHRRGKDDTVRFSRTIVRTAMDERMAILSADASSDERFSMAQSIADFSIRSVMCVPLLSHQGQKSLGVLQIDTQSQKHRFEAEDLQILTSVAAQASISIENAQMAGEMLNQARTQRELLFAKQVQASFLPKAMPEIPGYRFWAFYEAAGQVGGDYYDFVKLPNERHAVVVGDVAGKGVPAALMMANATSHTKVALLTHPDNFAEAMSQINNAICGAGIDDKFITSGLCVIDTRSHRLTIVNAGHMSPMIRRADGTIDEPADIEMTGLPIGIVEDFVYESVEADTAVGDVVVLFSDGISEAMNSNNEEYSIDRIRQKLRSVDLPPDKLGEFLLKDVKDHVGGHIQSDDITLVVFGRVDASEQPTPAKAEANLTATPPHNAEPPTSQEF